MSSSRSSLQGPTLQVALVCLCLLLFAVLVRPVHATNYTDIKINELMPHPNSGGEWVEIYYRNSEQATHNIDLSGWYFKDAAGAQKTISQDSPAVIEPNKFYLFSLSVNGWMNDTGTETIALYNADNTKVDEVTYGSGGVASAPSKGQSIGRSPDGTTSWFTYTDATVNAPTPGNSNPTPSSPSPSSTPGSSPSPSPSTSPSPSPSATPKATASPTPKPTVSPSPSPKSSPKPSPSPEVLGIESSPTPEPSSSPESKQAAVAKSGGFNKKLGIGIMVAGLLVLGAGAVWYALERRR